MHRTFTSLSAPVFSLVFFGCLIASNAQTRPSNPLPTNEVPRVDKTEQDSDEKRPLGTMEEEMRAKRELKFKEKQYKDNLERARQAAQLGAELRDSYNQLRSLSRDDVKRLERVEKLAKRIRSEAGGSEEGTSLDKPPQDLEATLSRIAEVSDCLKTIVEKTPRQVVSASVIDQANVLLELIKLARSLAR